MYVKSTVIEKDGETEKRDRPIFHPLVHFPRDNNGVGGRTMPGTPRRLLHECQETVSETQSAAFLVILAGVRSEAENPAPEAVLTLE